MAEEQLTLLSLPHQFPEILDNILNCLPLKYLKRCSRVSKTWLASVTRIIRRRKNIEVFSINFRKLVTRRQNSSLKKQIAAKWEEIKTNPQLALALVYHFPERDMRVEDMAYIDRNFPCEILKLAINHYLFYNNKEIAISYLDRYTMSCLLIPKLSDVRVHHFSPNVTNVWEDSNPENLETYAYLDIQVSPKLVQHLTGIPHQEKVKFIISFHEDHSRGGRKRCTFEFGSLYHMFHGAVQTGLELRESFTAPLSHFHSLCNDFGLEDGSPLYIAFCGEGVNVIAYGKFEDDDSNPENKKCIEAQIKALKEKYGGLEDFGHDFITMAFIVAASTECDIIVATFSKHFTETLVLGLQSGSDSMLYQDVKNQTPVTDTVPYRSLEKPDLYDKISAFYLISLRKK